VKRLFVLALAALAVGALVTADIADAKRMGGGRSLGTQRQNIAPATPTPPAAAPSTPSGAASNPVMPANPAAATAARPAAPGAPAAAPSGASRWLGPIAGIAAGIGLAALLSHLGLSEAFAGFLLLALLVVAGVFVLRWLFMRRTPAPSPLRYAGADRIEPTAPRGYESHVGPTWGAGAAAPVATANAKVPPGFDVDGFMRQAKQQFNRLQSAWDAGDREALADVMTPQMYAEVERDLGSRATHLPSEVVTLDAEVLEVVTEGSRHVASIRFHGLMREDGATTPQPFDEVWNLQKPVDGSSGWLLAGIQQLEQAA
jgi:predicted lipid-binding transport protein (Tim44 family)